MVFQYIHSLIISSYVHNLKIIYDSTHNTNLKIVCVSHTNIHWDQKASKRTFKQVTRNSWFRNSSIIFLKKICEHNLQTGYTATSFASLVCSKLYNSGTNYEEIGRSIYTAIEGRQKHK